MILITAIFGIWLVTRGSWVAEIFGTVTVLVSLVVAYDVIDND